MYFLTIRRFFKWNFTRNHPSRKEKNPRTFNESISEAPRFRKRCINPWLFIFLLAPPLYYHLFNKTLPERNKFVPEIYFRDLTSHPLNTYDLDKREYDPLVVVELYCYDRKKRKLSIETSRPEDIVLLSKQKTTPSIKVEPKIIARLRKTTAKKIYPPTKTYTIIPFKIFKAEKVTQSKGRIRSTARLINENNYNSKLPKCPKSDKEEDVKIDPILPTKEPSYQDVRMGGYYQPNDCRAKYKVALLVPYRDRERNLAIFIFNIHNFLIKQKLEYRIFVIEQYGKSKFNKGRLYNAGFKEMQKYGNWECVVFHDLDLLPLDNRIKYSCPIFPRHMCGSIIEKQKIHENTLFGGVTQMSLAHYRLVNGYSNNYWGWGGEDHDMFWRLQYARLPIVRYNKSISSYAHISHPRAIENPERYDILGQYLKKYKTEGKFRKEGLSTIVYEVISTKLFHLYTHIVVNIDLPFTEVTNGHKRTNK